MSDNDTSTSGMDRYQRPDGTPKKTGRVLHEDIAHVRIDDVRADSRYTVHVEHPREQGGVWCWKRSDRESLVASIRSHLDDLTDSDFARVDIVDAAGLDITEPELRPASYERSGPFAPSTPAVEVLTA